MGQPSGKFDYKVFYSKPPSYDIPIESIIPGGWDDEFDDDKLESEKEAETPKQPQRGVEDLLGQPSGKFDYKVFYSKPPSYNIPIESIVPGGWGDEFDDDQSTSREDKKTEDNEQSQEEAEEEIMLLDSIELLNRKETCMVEVWKNGKKGRTIGVIDIWYNSDEENAEEYNVWTNNQEVSQVTGSDKGYKSIENKTEKAMEKEEEVKEEDSDEPDDDLIQSN